MRAFLEPPEGPCPTCGSSWASGQSRHLGLGLVHATRRARSAGPACDLVPDGRDGPLAVRLARTVGCTPGEALPAVRHELDLSPGRPTT